MTVEDWRSVQRWRNGYIAPTVQRFTAHAQCFLFIPESKTDKSDQLKTACFRSCLLRNKNKTLKFYVYFDECSI